MKSNIIALLTALLTTSLAIPAAHAQTREIPYEGVLDDGGAPANGDYFFEFTLCDLQDCSGQQWQSGEVTLTATSGRFNASLGGAGQPALDDWIFSDDEVWLSIDVGDASGALTALAGVQKLVPNRFAISATQAEGVLDQRIDTLQPKLPDASVEISAGACSGSCPYQWPEYFSPTEVTSTTFDVSVKSRWIIQVRFSNMINWPINSNNNKFQAYVDGVSVAEIQRYSSEGRASSAQAIGFIDLDPGQHTLALWASLLGGGPAGYSPVQVQAVQVGVIP